MYDESRNLSGARSGQALAVRAQDYGPIGAPTLKTSVRMACSKASTRLPDSRSGPSVFSSAFLSKCAAKFAGKFRQTCLRPCSRSRRHVCRRLSLDLGIDLCLDLYPRLFRALFEKSFAKPFPASFGPILGCKCPRL